MGLPRWLLALVFVLIGAFVLTPFSALAQAQGKHFFKNVPVTGTLSDGGTFKGKVTITEFGYDEEEGLWVSGRLIGTAKTADGPGRKPINQSFSQVHATLNETASASSFGASSIQPLQEGCQILFLDIGPIFLDLLGLQVDLSEITLDITAVPGPGNLLGNLLCAVAGLLDSNGLLGELIGTLEELLDLLNQINDIIG